jgi:hypothetical protein
MTRQPEFAFTMSELVDLALARLVAHGDISNTPGRTWDASWDVYSGKITLTLKAREPAP